MRKKYKNKVLSKSIADEGTDSQNVNAIRLAIWRLVAVC